MEKIVPGSEDRPSLIKPDSVGQEEAAAREVRKNVRSLLRRITVTYSQPAKDNIDRDNNEVD